MEGAVRKVIVETKIGRWSIEHGGRHFEKKTVLLLNKVMHLSAQHSHYELLSTPTTSPYAKCCADTKFCQLQYHNKVYRVVKKIDPVRI